LKTTMRLHKRLLRWTAKILMDEPLRLTKLRIDHVPVAVAAAAVTVAVAVAAADAQAAAAVGTVGRIFLI
jgi:hypothetical protein